MVCGIAKGSKVMTKVLIKNSLREANGHHELLSLNVHSPFLSPFSALTEQAKTNCISG